MNSYAITPNPVIEGDPSTEELKTILQLQNQVLEKVVQDTTRAQILEQICHFVEKCVPDCVASIMLFDSDQKCLNVSCAPSIPREAQVLLDGMVPGVGAGSCGTSVFLGSPVFVIDTAEDNRWDQLRPIAQQLDLRACWSYPIRTDADEIAGSFAISSFTPRQPTPFHAQLLEAAANIAGIVLNRFSSQENLQHKERLLENITQAMPGVVYQYHLDDELKQSFTYIGPGIETISGITAEAAIEDFSEFWEQVHPDDRSGLWASIVHTGKHGLAWSHEFRVFHKNGQMHWVRGSALPSKLGSQEGLLWNGIILDITPEKASIEQLRLAGIAFSSTNEGIMITDKRNRIIDINRAYMNISGYGRDELIGKNPSILRSEHHSNEFYQSIWKSLEEERHWQGEIWNRLKNGEVVPHWVNINAVHDPNTDALTHFVSVIADISNIKASEEKLSHLAHHDALTNLPNRLLFSARLDHALTHREASEKIVMFHLDLDRFKHINDSLGHKYGDQLLLQVTERLKGVLSDKDTLARVGGDEFAILVEELEHVSDAESIADRLVEAMEQPFTLDGKDYFTTASIGLALAPDHGDDIDTLTKHADIALNQAKDSGRNNFAFFQPELSETVQEWIKLEPELRKALAENQFQLHYQPQVDSTGTAIVGAEALIRWHHPEMGIIPPNQFLPIAEEIGLMNKIGEWVMNTALEQLSFWRSRGLIGFRLAINLAGDQITKQNLPMVVMQALEHFQIPAEMLELEILETFLMEHEEEATSTFKQLRELGVHLSLDDFGTGYSALSYLKKLPITKVKIDQSLVRDIPEDPNDEAIAKAVILLAHTLDLTVCAEGVETRAQREFLESENCDQLQGYLFSKPIEANAFTNLLKKHNKLA
ncbi:EAL domain-containing protein [Neptuniibacter caesariensis]|uniref:cyclic-guanylate-specific phosphodiesterase n=1 Tax=Neptuniibacter caesariensis TaxID=207954 RepID=A0A7U8C8V4_NEPCE|nr:EAL domain-containing protein [Neptuniibacter caesariensis]EAR62274.1 diguanylate cyclase/phosphodiesterase (GGDEF & EAL domains) withPAS/PAC sensor [Oceanospirillum sp. MED92] [Neptuniibacter caesariensis]